MINLLCYLIIDCHQVWLVFLTRSNGPPRLSICHQSAVHKRKIRQVVLNTNTFFCFKLQCAIIVYLLYTVHWWQIERRGGPLHFTPLQVCSAMYLHCKSYIVSRLVNHNHVAFSFPVLVTGLRAIKSRQVNTLLGTANLSFRDVQESDFLCAIYNFSSKRIIAHLNKKLGCFRQ